MPRNNARAEKEATREEEKVERSATGSRRRHRPSGGQLSAAQLAEPPRVARTANAVADLGRAGSHDMLAPGTHKGGQPARGVDGSFHDWEIGQQASQDVQGILERTRLGGVNQRAAPKRLMPAQGNAPGLSSEKHLSPVGVTEPPTP